jgi:hypothetical protein
MEFITEDDINDNEKMDISIKKNDENSKSIIFLSKSEREKIEKNKLEEIAKLEKAKEQRNKRHKLDYIHNKPYYDKERRKKLEERKKTKQELEEEEDLKQIKNYYLGVKKRRKKKDYRSKESSKDFFVFDWKDTDDTTKDLKKIYIPKSNSSLLFGRGHMGGEDEEEMKMQKKKYENLVEAFNEKNNKNKLNDNRKKESKYHPRKSKKFLPWKKIKKRKLSSSSYDDYKNKKESKNRSKS